MKNQIESASDTVTFAAPSGGVVGGNGYLIGTMLCVAVVTAAVGVRTAFKRLGTFTLPKNSAEAWTEGAVLYWDNTNFRLTTTATANFKVGVAAAVAANPSSAGSCLLTGESAAATGAT
jgi:predicted RecA/RadA family phage recombinase